MDYKILDSGHGRKLEQVGPYRFVRPAMNAFWKPSLKKSEWDCAHGVFERNSSGGGKWKWQNGGTPESWIINFLDVNILVKPTSFGHLGFFAEHKRSWDWTAEYVKKADKEVKVLNLFAYSGVGSIALTKAGAKVTHLDAARGMIQWGQESLSKNPDVPSSIRWIADDVIKFLQREIRRGNKYNGIIMDPPSFGRGSQGQVWKMEEQVNELLDLCNQVIDKSDEYFVILSCHTPGFSPVVLERLLKQTFSERGATESGEMTFEEESGRLLPAGTYSRIVVE